MELFTGNFDGLGPHVMADLARYRYRVFVERLGWDLACVRGWPRWPRLMALPTRT